MTFTPITKDTIPDYNFIRVPTDIADHGLSCYAQILYIFLLGRLSLSVHNNWIDEDGNYYVICTVAEAMERLACSKSKALSAFGELEGFIKTRRQGLGKPNMIYINSAFFKEKQVSHTDFKKSAAETSGSLCETPLEVSETDSNKININKINNNKININKNNAHPSYLINPYNWIEDRRELKEKLKLNIDYDALVVDYPKEPIDEILNAMVNAACSPLEYIVISGVPIPTEEIREKFLRMSYSHIEYVYNSLRKNKTLVRNMSAYLLTTLYRASDHINLHYLALS